MADHSQEFCRKTINVNSTILRNVLQRASGSSESDSGVGGGERDWYGKSFGSVLPASLIV